MCAGNVQGAQILVSIKLLNPGAVVCYLCTVPWGVSSRGLLRFDLICFLSEGYCCSALIEYTTGRPMLSGRMISMWRWCYGCCLKDLPAYSCSWDFSLPVVTIVSFSFGRSMLEWRLRCLVLGLAFYLVISR